MGAALAAAPALAQGPVQVPIEVDQPLPNVGDQVRLRTDALQTAPYNQDPDRYRVVFFGCVGTAEQCRDRRRWQRLAVRDARGAEVQPRRLYECASGPCEMVIRLAEPRAATIHFRAVVHDMEDQGNDLSPALAVRWVEPPAVLAPQLAGAGPSLTLTVQGVTCTARLGIDSNRCTMRSPDGATIAIAPDGTAPAPSVQAVLNGYPDNWTIHYTWTIGSGGPCGNPCAPTNLALPGPFGQPPSSYINRASVQVDINWNGSPGTNPATGTPFEPLTAVVAVDYIAPRP